ncbi:MAG: sigma-54 dependent transcriptional regulator [Bdellovibrionia bacterium]
MSTLPKILALDDDKSWLSQIPLILEDEGVDLHCYSSIDQGLKAMETQFFDVVLLDINFKGDPRSGLDVFRLIQAMDRGADVIVISGETNPNRLIQIMNAGVTHFITKPTPPDEVAAAVRTILEQREMRLRALNLSKTNEGGVSLVGSSSVMKRLRKEVSQVISAGTRDVLLIGETGSGKDIVAQTIAHQADRSKRFIPVHCGAISEGLAESELFGHVKGAFTGADRDRAGAFESAGGGFVFLDELGDMPLPQQAKLLRVIQSRKVQRVGSHDEREVNFRCIAATNVDLESAILQKRFREDLYYRIAKAKIHVPSLRERPEDIPELVQFFLAEISPKKQIMITSDASEMLQVYHWPGNVRHLKAVVESMCAKAEDGVIREKDVCQAIPQAVSAFGSRASRVMIGRYGASLITRERDRFERAIIESNGDRDRAAISLGLSRATFFRRAKELGLVKQRRVRSQQQDSSDFSESQGV